MRWGSVRACSVPSGREGSLILTWNMGLILKPHSCLPPLRGESSKSHYCPFGRLPFRDEWGRWWECEFCFDWQGCPGCGKTCIFMLVLQESRTVHPFFSLTVLSVWPGPRDVTRSAVTLTLFRGHFGYVSRLGHTHTQGRSSGYACRGHYHPREREWNHLMTGRKLLRGCPFKSCLLESHWSSTLTY